jgi:hypothetical protein
MAGFFVPVSMFHPRSLAIMYFYFKQGVVMLNTKFKFNFKFTCAAALSLALLGE